MVTTFTYLCDVTWWEWEAGAVRVRKRGVVCGRCSCDPFSGLKFITDLMHITHIMSHIRDGLLGVTSKFWKKNHTVSKLWKVINCICKMTTSLHFTPSLINHNVCTCNLLSWQRWLVLQTEYIHIAAIGESWADADAIILPMRKPPSQPVVVVDRPAPNFTSEQLDLELQVP